MVGGNSVGCLSSLLLAVRPIRSQYLKRTDFHRNPFLLMTPSDQTLPCLFVFYDEGGRTTDKKGVAL